MAHQLEARMSQERRDIAARSGEEIVDAEYVVSPRDQAFAQMRADEAGSAGDQYAAVERHESSLS